LRLEEEDGTDLKPDQKIVSEVKMRLGIKTVLDLLSDNNCEFLNVATKL